MILKMAKMVWSWLISNMYMPNSKSTSKSRDTKKYVRPKTLIYIPAHVNVISELLKHSLHYHLQPWKTTTDNEVIKPDRVLFQGCEWYIMRILHFLDTSRVWVFEDVFAFIPFGSVHPQTPFTLRYYIPKYKYGFMMVSTQIMTWVYKDSFIFDTHQVLI